MNSESIAVIIPCYNEALTIGKVVDDFHRELPQATVYVYDNNSSDDTHASPPSTAPRSALSPVRERATCAARCFAISTPIAT